VKKFYVCFVLFFFLMAGNAKASFFGDDGTLLQEFFNEITVNGESSIQVTTDMLSDDLDSYWSITSSEGFDVTLIFELAGFAPYNRFGIFDASNPNNIVRIFSRRTDVGAQATLSIKPGGKVWLNGSDTGVIFSGRSFGFYMDSTLKSDEGGGFWYSDTSLNDDGIDHMYAYQGKDQDTINIPGYEPFLWKSNQYILAFEDLEASVSDRDYTDLVVFVESIDPNPIVAPIPAILFLLE